VLFKLSKQSLATNRCKDFEFFFVDYFPKIKAPKARPSKSAPMMIIAV
jgi:hypothetical protein